MSIAETAVEEVAGGAATSSMLPWLLLVGVIAFIAAMTAAFFEGKHVETTVFDKYVSDQKAAAEQQLADNKSALLAQASKDQAAMDAIKATHQGAINEITQRRDALVTANRDLTQRLYVATASPSAHRSIVPGTSASGLIDNADGTASLSIGSSEFFISEFAQADLDIATITALQQVVLEDRVICNGSLPGVTAPSNSVPAQAPKDAASEVSVPVADPTGSTVGK